MQTVLAPPQEDLKLHTRVLRTLAEMEEIRENWESWPGHLESEIDFFATVLRERRETIRPHVIVVYRGSQPDAMFAGRLDDMRLDRLNVGYIRVQPQAKVLYFVYGALRGNASSANCELIYREIQRSLAAGEAEIAYLNYLAHNVTLYGLATSRPGILARDRVRKSQRHYSATLPQSPEAFRQQLSPKVRKNQRWNKMNRDFPDAVRIRAICDPAQLQELTTTAEGIARTSYQRGLGVGFADTSQERQRLQLKAERGWLRAFFLYIGETPAAYWIGDASHGTFGSEYLGFDPQFAKYSPGMFLILKVLEGFCGGPDGVVTADFGVGHAEYKEAFSNVEREETEVYIFAPSLRGVALNLAKTSAMLLHNALKSVLRRTGLLQKVKTQWRQRLKA